MKKSMRHYLVTLFMILMVVSSVAAQSNTEAPKQNSTASLQYKMQYAFAMKTKYFYKFTCSTQVHRVYEGAGDGDSKDFTRIVDVYVTFWQPSSTQEGFAEVRTYFDSLHYNYICSDTNVKWSSAQSDFIPNNADFDYYFPVVGRTFTSTISPYFELAKISSDQLKEFRDALKDMKDTVLRDIWLAANEDENLAFYADMNKNVLRPGRFSIDSIWKMHFTIPIEGIHYTCDTAKVQFYLYDGKNFNVKAEMPKMYPALHDSGEVLGYSRLVLPVDSSSSSEGYWDISVSPRGLIDKVVGSFKTSANRTMQEHKFTDNITTTIKIELTNFVKWD
jgi:hypothetical protein